MISEDKVQVILSVAELRRYNLTFSELSYDNPVAKKAISMILMKAGRMCGFSPGRGRLLIEVFPMRDGGCCIFFTRLRPRTKRYRLVKSSQIKGYEFDRLGDLLKAAGNIHPKLLAHAEVRAQDNSDGGADGKTFALLLTVAGEAEKMILSEFGRKSVRRPEWWREYTQKLADGPDLCKIIKLYDRLRS